MASKKQEIERVPFKGRFAEMKPESPWLSSEDLEDIGKDVELTIKELYRNNNVKDQNGQTKNNVFSLEFENAKKHLWLNMVNKRRIKKMYGSPSNWPGKTIKLYIDPLCKHPDGTKGPGIRVREEKK